MAAYAAVGVDVGVVMVGTEIVEPCGGVGEQAPDGDEDGPTGDDDGLVAEAADQALAPGSKESVGVRGTTSPRTVLGLVDKT